LEPKEPSWIGQCNVCLELSSVSEQLQLMSAERDYWKSQYEVVHSELNSTRKVII